MEHLFSYGTLQLDAVQMATFGLYVVFLWIGALLAIAGDLTVAGPPAPLREVVER